MLFWCVILSVAGGYLDDFGLTKSVLALHVDAPYHGPDPAPVLLGPVDVHPSLTRLCEQLFELVLPAFSVGDILALLLDPLEAQDVTGEKLQDACFGVGDDLRLLEGFELLLFLLFSIMVALTQLLPPRDAVFEPFIVHLVLCLLDLRELSVLESVHYHITWVKILKTEFSVELGLLFTFDLLPFSLVFL